MGRQPNTECKICGKPLYRRPFEFKEGKDFFCNGCRREVFKNNPEIWKGNLEKGRGWNKGKSKKNGDILLYGRPRSDVSKKRISEGEKRFCRENPNKIKKRALKLKGRTFSEETFKK